MQGLADPDVLRIAAQQDRVLISHDFKTMPRHFADFLQTYGSSPGAFLVKQSSPIGPVIEELLLIWTATDAEEWKGQLGQPSGGSPSATLQEMRDLPPARNTRKPLILV